MYKGRVSAKSARHYVFDPWPCCSHGPNMRPATPLRERNKNVFVSPALNPRTDQLQWERIAAVWVSNSCKIVFYSQPTKQPTKQNSNNK